MDTNKHELQTAKYTKYAKANGVFNFRVFRGSFSLFVNSCLFVSIRGSLNQSALTPIIFKTRSKSSSLKKRMSSEPFPWR